MALQLVCLLWCTKEAEETPPTRKTLIMIQQENMEILTTTGTNWYKNYWHVDWYPVFNKQFYSICIQEWYTKLLVGMGFFKNKVV